MIVSETYRCRTTAPDKYLKTIKLVYFTDSFFAEWCTAVQVSDTTMLPEEQMPIIEGIPFAGKRMKTSRNGGLDQLLQIIKNKKHLYKLD